MRTQLVALAALAGAPSLLGSAITLARADGVTGTRGGELLVESRESIGITLDRGHATLVVRRTFHNGSARFDQADVGITDFPGGAVATGLRTQGTRNGQPIWYEGALMEAEAAARKYAELTGLGGYYPKDPALLSWRHGGLALQVFPIEPGGSKTVEYTLEAPTHYLDGRDVVVLPPVSGGARPMVTLTGAHAGDTLRVGAGEVASGTTFPLSDDGARIELVRSAKDQSKLGGAYADVFFAPGRALMHTSIEIAPRLSELPREPWVVVALDASRSMSDAQRRAEITAARAYLEALPDAHVMVTTFARTTRPRSTGFVSVTDARADLAALTLPGENGSALDAALLDAGARLTAAAPPGATRRIVAITDFRTRVALQSATVTALTTATHSLVHLASIDDGPGSLARDDDDPWAAPARATGGLLWRARARAKEAGLGSGAGAFEEWARPLRIDRIAVRGVGLDGDALGVPPSMREGQGFEDLRLAKFAPPALLLTGELWSTPQKTLLAPDDEHDRLWSALIFGAPEVSSELRESEMMTLAFKGHAVSPVTSYLAIEPGVRPSTEGLHESESFGDGGIGLSGVGVGGGGAGIGLGVAESASLAWLQSALAPSRAQCGAAARSAKLHVETTSREVVDVRLAALSGAKDPLIERCLEDAAWALDLPASFEAHWAVYDVILAAAPEQ